MTGKLVHREVITCIEKVCGDITVLPPLAI